MFVEYTKYGIRQENSQKSFAGSYQRIGAKLVQIENPTIRLVIGTRQKTTKSKPEHFLLLMEGRSNPAIYFSSLYPTSEPNLFEVEYQRVRYRLVLNSDKAEISVLNQSQQAA